MMDLRQYTTKEFAEVIDENAEVIKDLMRNNPLSIFYIRKHY